MKKLEEVMNLRSLKRQGYSNRAIARAMGIDPRTVKKYLEQNRNPIYKVIIRHSKLDKYKPLIAGWLKIENYQASRIWRILQEQGYNGAYDTVQREVKKLKEERDQVAYIRFETMPGKQAQVDFAELKIICSDGSELTLYCFIMVLGYSRHMYIEFVDKCTMTTFQACHQHAFDFFGGNPSEILYDNMKNVVVRRLVGKVEWNKEFMSFAVHYGFKLIAAPVLSPWVKGKVERSIEYGRESFWRGYVYNNLEQSNIDVRQWLKTVAFERVHGTTKEKVSTRFIQEQKSLGELPSQHYDISEKVYRKVYKDCQLSFDGNRYVVPHENAGKKVLLKIRNGVMRIFKDEKQIAIYNISSGKGQTIAEPKFYQKLKEDKEQLRRKYRKPYGKAKATQGLVANGLRYEVTRRSLSEYEQLV